jgi:hypothetical protein
MTEQKLWWTTGSGRIELQMTVEQACSAYHQGACDDDVDALSREPEIAAQLATIDPELLKSELREWGAWDDEELADHDQNLQRLLWLAAADIFDDPERFR